MPEVVRRSWPALLAAGVAAGLACWSLGYGLPFEFRPDEDVMVGHSVRMAATGSLDPLFANYPPLVFYLLAGLEKLAGQAAATPRDPTAAYLVARGLSVLADACTAGLTALAAARAYGTAAAVVAGLLAATAPLATRQGHFGTTDFVQAALVAAALLAAVRAEGRRSFAVAGALCGLAAAAKYTGGLALLAVLAMAWQSPGRRRLLEAALAGAAAAFAVPCLVMLLHPDDYGRGLFFLGGRAYGGTFQLPLGWLYFPVSALPYSLGLGAYPLALAGIAVAAWRRERLDLALLAFVVAYYAVTGAGRENFFRYLLPLLPPLALLAGGALRAAPARLGPAVALVLLLPGLYASVETDLLLGQTDTRQLAAAWLDRHADAGAVLKAPYYASPYYSEDDWLQGRWTDRYLVEFESTVGPPPDYQLAASPAPYQFPDPPLSGVDSIAAAHCGAVYDPIDSYYLPIWGFGCVDRPGPTLVIIRRRAG